jgi:ParB-like chromosome segregation protein Spo0J
MKIEKLPTGKLIPYARNAKKHDAAQVSKLAGSIREFGFNNPVLIDADNGIIAGHGRVLAAQQLGLSEVPCIRLGHLTDNQRKAYILADNRLAEIGVAWDEEILKQELQGIEDSDLDLALTGFSLDDFLKDPVKVKSLTVDKPPDMAWILISIPIEQFGKVQKLMESLPEDADTYSTYTNEKNGQP